MLGVCAALLAFRNRRTRALGVLATVGLWIVSSTAFVVVAIGLLTAGLIFVASRFARGHWLLLAGALTVAAGLLVMRGLVGFVTEDPAAQTRAEVQVPTPDSMRYTNHVIRGSEAQTPLSLSIPHSDQYVSTTRQLITEKQPFEPRVLYITTQTLGLMKLGWLAITLLLGWQFRGKLTNAWATVKERLAKRPPPKPAAKPAHSLEYPPPSESLSPSPAE